MDMTLLYPVGKDVLSEYKVPNEIISCWNQTETKLVAEFKPQITDLLRLIEHVKHSH